MSIPSSLRRVDHAIRAVKQGRMVILVDDESRENEGDIVLPGCFATAQKVHFMLRECSGLVCLAMTQSNADRLAITPMVANNKSGQQTPFGVSFEAAEGISTGVSAQDRAYSIQVACDPTSTAQSIVQPGHILPLIARPRGVMEREGHTEGSVDLMKAAQLPEAAVICEVMNDDGTMARYDDLMLLSKKHDLPMLSIADLRCYRKRHECWVTGTEPVTIPTRSRGSLSMQVFIDSMSNEEYTLVYSPTQHASPWLRIHSRCFTGDVLGSLRCDCGDQLEQALDLIAKEGGYCLYTPDEGRGIGLTQKMNAYRLQEQGYDTVDANLELGLLPDQRDYAVCVQILRVLGIEQVRLLTNNPTKQEALTHYGITVSACQPLIAPVNDHNRSYLQTKRDKMRHTLSVEEVTHA